MSAPLAGLRVLDYGQYVAGPFATMLLSDLGADVVKVEPPRGDEWRRYDPIGEGESAYFHALNRGKRSVALDLKSEEGRAASRELIASADALVHNCLPERARAFGLDEASVREVNPRCAVVSISAFGSEGPDADRPAYDLIAQALSGLLLAQPRSADRCRAASAGSHWRTSPPACWRRCRWRPRCCRASARHAPSVEVSLLGAALALQAQRFVELPGAAPAGRGPRPARGGHRGGRGARPLLPSAPVRDGFVALACLNANQREQVCELFGLEDAFTGNPQAEPAGADERELRLAHAAAVEAGFAGLSVADAVRRSVRAACRPARCARSRRCSTTLR